MTRWKVQCINRAHARGALWAVRNPEGVAEYFTRNWTEALAFADRQARTIEVTLPRGVNEVRLGPNAWLELRADGGASVHGGCGSIGIRKYALERTALALLAHSRRIACPKPSLT